MKPSLELKFPEPRNGYWDGGKKSGGVFSPSMYPFDSPKHPGKGAYIKWGCYELNFWFVAKAGRSWKEDAAIAKRKLEHLVKVAGSMVSIINKEAD